MDHLTKHIFSILLLTIFILPNNTFAYTMPIGIPDTSIDFKQPPPQRPSNWSKEVPGYYYIDAKKGSSSRKFGSEKNPKKNIPNSIPAGSYVEISGNYSAGSGGVILILAKGTKQKWVAGKSGAVWITSSPKKLGAFTEKKVILSGSNAFITGMVFKNRSLLQIGSFTKGYPAENIVVRNNEISGYIELASGSLLSVLGNNEQSASKNIIFFKNTVKDAGDISTPKDLDAGLIAIAGYASNIWVLQNTGYNASGTGIQVNAKPPRTATHNIYVGNNEFYNVRQSGLWVKYAQNVVFSSNYIHDIITTPHSPAKGIGGQYEPEGLWIINNHIHGVEYGIRIPSTSKVEGTKLKVYAIGNIIHNVQTKKAVGTNNTWESAAIHLVGAQEHYIYNNLIFDATNGINISGYNKTAKTVIQNNIIFDLTKGHLPGNSGYHIWTEGRNNLETLSIANNFFSEDMKVRLIKYIYERAPMLEVSGHLNNIRGKISIPDNSLKSIINSIKSTPSVSVKIQDAGQNNTDILITAYKKQFPKSKGINIDFLNSPRIVGKAIDIGPFELSLAESNIQK